MPSRRRPKRKSGRASPLQAGLAHATQRQGVDLVALSVTEGNAPAIRLYEENEFRGWGTQPWAIATPSGLKGKVHMSCRLRGTSAAP